jgi:glycosyltransferase involved in cell wall biosynthesis
MRVSFILRNLDLGGGIRVIAQYAVGLQKRGHDVYVISPPPAPQGRIQTWKQRIFPGTPERRPSHFDGSGVGVNILKHCRPVKAADVPIADVVIATWWETAAWIADYPANRGKKVHFVQDYEIWNGHKEKVDACLRLPLAKITISKWLESILIDQLGTSKPFWVANGIDRTMFRAVRQAKPEIPTIGLVYTTNPRKGSDIALEAIALLKAKHPKLKVVAFGHAASTSNDSLSHFDDFHISPDQDTLHEIYGQCTAWVFASREEGFGLPILEAMACGTPVAATAAGAAPEILAGGGGVLASDFTPQSMAAAISEIITLPDLAWVSLSQNAMNNAATYDLELAIDRFENTLLAIHSSN